MAEIFFRPRAVKGFNSASRHEQDRIRSAMEILKSGNFPPHTRKLGGAISGYRIRIGKWRILFVLKGSEIDVVDMFIKKGRSDYSRRI